MDFPLFLLAFVMLWKKSTLAIQCYKCIPERLPGDYTPLCDEFDRSERFVADCPLSTGCVKKSIQLLGVSGNTESSTRDCASQTMSGYQEQDASGRWQPVDKIHEVYEEGCKEDPSEFDKPTKAIQCFCRGHLCNGAESFQARGLSFKVIMFSFCIYVMY